MAHFAKISEENIVLTVNVVDDGNSASEEKGQAFLERVHGWPEHLWIQTSYNTIANTHRLGGTPFRGNYAGIKYFGLNNLLHLGQKIYLVLHG